MIKVKTQVDVPADIAKKLKEALYHLKHVQVLHVKPSGEYFLAAVDGTVPLTREVINQLPTDETVDTTDQQQTPPVVIPPVPPAPVIAPPAPPVPPVVATGATINF